MNDRNANNKPIAPLGFNYAYDTPSEAEYPLLNTVSNDPKITEGWSSVRYCPYPQVLILKFFEVVSLRQIKLLFHQYKIPKRVDVFFFNPQSFLECNIDCRVMKFERLGYIIPSANDITEYKLREMKSIMVNTQCLYLKFQLSECYGNELNMFKQVGLIRVECFGRGIGKESIEQLVLNEAEKSKIRPSIDYIDLLIKDDDFDDISRNKIRLLKDELYIETDNDIKNELNALIEDIRVYAKKIVKLKQLERNYIYLKQISKANEVQNEIKDIQMIILNIPPSNYPLNNQFKEFFHNYDQSINRDYNQEDISSSFDYRNQINQPQIDYQILQGNEYNNYNYNYNYNNNNNKDSDNYKDKNSEHSKRKSSQEILQKNRLKKKLIEESHQISARENILYEANLNL